MQKKVHPAPVPPSWQPALFLAFFQASCVLSSHQQTESHTGTTEKQACSPFITLKNNQESSLLSELEKYRGGHMCPGYLPASANHQQTERKSVKQLSPPPWRAYHKMPQCTVTLGLGTESLAKSGREGGHSCENLWAVSQALQNEGARARLWASCEGSKAALEERATSGQCARRSNKKRHRQGCGPLVRDQKQPSCGHVRLRVPCEGSKAPSMLICGSLARDQKRSKEHA
eukprot:373485-Pelagomonas_calceolata.AAC.3